MSLEPAGVEALDELLKGNVGAGGVEAVRQLTGGASRQTYAVEVRPGVGRGGDYVLQREISAEPRLPNGMADEADLVTAAGRAGVPA
ncbi:MAG: phosphotransferase family protein, partial [Acidimicrobiales bacterium]